MRFLQPHYQSLRQLLLTVYRDLCATLYLFSSGSNARGESGANEGRRVSSKSPSRVQDGDEGVAGRNERGQCFPNKGNIDLPSRQMIFHLQKGNWKEKIELAARPGAPPPRPPNPFPSLAPDPLRLSVGSPKAAEPLRLSGSPSLLGAFSEGFLFPLRSGP